MPARVVWRRRPRGDWKQNAGTNQSGVYIAGGEDFSPGIIVCMSSTGPTEKSTLRAQRQNTRNRLYREERGIQLLRAAVVGIVAGVLGVLYQLAGSPNGKPSDFGRLPKPKPGLSAVSYCSLQRPAALARLPPGSSASSRRNRAEAVSPTSKPPCFTFAK